MNSSFIANDGANDKPSPGAPSSQGQRISGWKTPRSGSASAKDLLEELRSFKTSIPYVFEAVIAASDGRLLATATEWQHANDDRLAASISALTSLGGGVAQWFSLASVNCVIADFSEGYLLAAALSPLLVLGVVADRRAELGTLAYAVTAMAERVKHHAGPGIVAELEGLRPHQ